MREKAYPPPVTANDAMAATLRAYIGESGLGIKGVAEAAGIKEQTLGRYYVTGMRAITLEIVWAVAAALGTTGTELMADAERRLAKGLAASVKDPDVGGAE